MKKNIIYARLLLLTVILQANLKIAYCNGFDTKKAIDFYGHQFLVTVNSNVLANNFTLTNLDQKSIYACLTSFDSYNLDSICDNLIVLQKQYELDDWATYMVLQKYTEQVLKNKNTNFKNIFKYYVLNKMNYEVILIYTNTSALVHGKLNSIPEGSCYVPFNNNFYTKLDYKNNCENANGFVYKPNLNRVNGKTLAINRYKKPKLNAKIIEKQFKFYYKKEYVINGKINKSLAEYYAEMPLWELSPMYVNYEFSDELRLSVLDELKKASAGLGQLDQINLLLKFCQLAIEYKTDFENVGKEHSSFPEETMYGKYADCEDKALLMAKLCKEILNINSVIMYYKDEQHVNLGLQLDIKGTGYNFTYKDKKYLVCEPAYIGFKVGETQKELMKVGKVIPLYL